MLTLQRFDIKCICCKSQPADVDLDDERKKSPLKKAGCQNVRKCGCQNSWRKLGVSILKSKAIDLDAVPYLCKWISLFHFVNVIQFNFIQFIYLKLCERFWFWKQHKLCVHLHTLFVIIFGGKLQLQQLKNHTILFKIIIVFQSDDHKNLYKFQIVFRLCYESIMFSRQHYYSVITVFTRIEMSAMRFSFSLVRRYDHSWCGINFMFCGWFGWFSWCDMFSRTKCFWINRFAVREKRKQRWISKMNRRYSYRNECEWQSHLFSFSSLPLYATFIILTTKSFSNCSIVYDASAASIASNMTQRIDL